MVETYDIVKSNGYKVDGNAQGLPSGIANVDTTGAVAVALSNVLPPLNIRTTGLLFWDDTNHRLAIVGGNGSIYVTSTLSTSS